mmetsp:Transcript_39056/g.100076  ORF Transcript_39056/g.100076 Transcript_39056/m.100076 type:complete len:96 (+) Transcript_39056:331-618(+)
MPAAEADFGGIGGSTRPFVEGAFPIKVRMRKRKGEKPQTVQERRAKWRKEAKRSSWHLRFNQLIEGANVEASKRGNSTKKEKATVQIAEMHTMNL